jgi:hypothetical protein
LPESSIVGWNRAVDKLPGFLFNFVRKGMQQQLPTLANLFRWGRAENNNCPLCSSPQTNKHVLSNCSNSAVLERFSNRHAKILKILAEWVYSKIDNTVDFFVDLKNSSFKQISDLFIDLRPDMAIISGNSVHVIELTVCHESNIISSKQYKTDKYKNLKNHRSSLISNHEILLITCEVSVLGFFSCEKKLLNLLSIDKMESSISDKIACTVIQESFDIYLLRNG